MVTINFPVDFSRRIPVVNNKSMKSVCSKTKQLWATFFQW